MVHQLGSFRFARVTVLQQLLYQIHMCHNHAPAAVSLAPKFVHSVSVGTNIVRPGKGHRK